MRGAIISALHDAREGRCGERAALDRIERAVLEHERITEAAGLLQEATDRVERVQDSGILDDFDMVTAGHTARALAYLRNRVDQQA